MVARRNDQHRNRGGVLGAPCERQSGGDVFPQLHHQQTPSVIVDQGGNVGHRLDLVPGGAQLGKQLRGSLGRVGGYEHWGTSREL